jgi:hypothetical protein
MRLLLRKLIRSALVAGAAAVLTSAVALAPARAATATFPVVQDCSPFTEFYRTWQPLPTTLYADGTSWVPQGLTYDPTHRWLLMSYYDGRAGVPAAEKWPSMLVVTTLRGTVLKTLSFNTGDVDRGGHAGGLGVGKGNLYVSSTEHGPRVTRIPLREIARTHDGAMLPDSPTVDVAAASYATYSDGAVFVGDFENDRLYRYPTTDTGDLIMSGVTQYPTPTLIQGVAVTAQKFVFSRSYGRTRLSYLTVVDRQTGDEQSTVLPNMAEGITWGPGRNPAKDTDLYVLFESGSAAYGPEASGGSSTCRTHELWHRPAQAVI